MESPPGRWTTARTTTAADGLLAAPAVEGDLPRIPVRYSSASRNATDDRGLLPALDVMDRHAQAKRAAPVSTRAGATLVRELDSRRDEQRIVGFGSPRAEEVRFEALSRELRPHARSGNARDRQTARAPAPRHAPREPERDGVRRIDSSSQASPRHRVRSSSLAPAGRERSRLQQSAGKSLDVGACSRVVKAFALATCMAEPGLAQ